MYICTYGYVYIKYIPKCVCKCIYITFIKVVSFYSKTINQIYSCYF